MVDRATRCILCWKVTWECSQAIVQNDEAPKAKRYFSDAFDVYASLWYHFGYYAVSIGKTDTFSVEANNAELRHYLARLARCSRCFSRCPYALDCAVRLFVYYFNQRQLRKHAFPKYNFLSLVLFTHPFSPSLNFSKLSFTEFKWYTKVANQTN